MTARDDRTTDDRSAGPERAEDARAAPTRDDRVGDRETDGPAEIVAVDPEPQPRTIYGTALAVREHERRPIIPAWMRNREEARQLAGWLTRFGLHAAGYHLTRLPKYALRLLWRAPRGLWVLALAAAGWVFDREGTPLRLAAVARGSTHEYMTLSNQRNRRVRQRLPVVAAVAVLLAAGWAVLLWWAPGWALLVAAPVAVVVLGKLGTPRDRRVTDVATVSSAAPPRLTAEVVTRALQSLGISAMSAKGPPIAYVAPITRDGPGWRADLDLPHGVTVADVMERRDRLASGLRRPLSAVWPEASAEQHAGRLILWVGDQPLNKVRPAAWPLARTGTVQIIGGRFPFGTDQRQRPVQVALEETNALIGALPGGGKTAAVRVLALAAALDVHCELRIGEHKGSGDLEALELVAHRYASGVDDEALAATLDSLRDLLREVGDRAKRLGKLPRNLVPDKKVTPDLAARKGSGLHPIVQVIDEAQELFIHPDMGKEAGELAERIIKRGRAFGVYLVIATQRPDAKSVPSGVSGNVGLRFCLRVTGQVENDMVLGTSAYRNGIRATTFTPSDRGIGYLVGAGDDPLVVRTYYIDGPTAWKIAERARAARETAGTLCGYALGEQVAAEPVADLLDDVRAVFATAGGDRMQHADLLAALVELRPDVYSGWDVRKLGAELRARGVATVQVAELVEGKRVNRNGCTRDAVDKVLAGPPERPEIEP